MIGSSRKICPRCAERVKGAAELCRYCGHDFPAKTLRLSNSTMLAGHATVTLTRRAWPPSYVMAGLAFTAIMIVVVLVWAMTPRVDKPMTAPRVARERIVREDPPHATPAGPELAVGETIAWSADKNSFEMVRKVGPLLVRVTRATEDELIAPVITVSSGGDSMTMVGEMVSSGYTHRISAVRIMAGAPPVVMLQSFSGGAHCCNHVQLSGLMDGRVKVIDLGSWDGDELPLPSDLNGDGVADFVERDNAFLYAFAAYAMSYAPPKILNVSGSRVTDVSRRPAYRRLYVAEMTKAGETCRTAADGMDRNGACPSYVASAARVGRLDEAWADMMRSYSAAEDWDYPTGCTLKTKGECPEASRVVYKSYPEALLAFLKKHDYVPAAWIPRSTSNVDAGLGGEAEVVKTY